MKPTEILNPNQREKSKCYLVNKIREEVYSWRKNGYIGATETTKRLLNYWFEEEHITEEEKFEFWFCQREAIETLIYVYEVMKKRNFIDMARDFADKPIYSYDPSIDQYPLYAFKMATGSGKTFVMAFAIVWSYFNYKKENKDYYTSKFLLISGNTNVVFERIKRDYEDCKIFNKYPFIPKEWQEEFDLKVILKEDQIHIIPEAVLFLTNIQQLEEKKNRKEEVEEYVDDVLVLEEVKRHDIYQENRIKEVLTSCSNIMILKDEAHHIYSFEKAWKKILLELNKNLTSQYGKGINMELDFTATPKTETGALFPWIIVDFSLKEAIEMNITKRPLRGIIKKGKEIASKKADEKYYEWIEVGIRRWREHKEKLMKLDKKPILFLMCENTTEADDVYSYINKENDLKGKVLLIHTNLEGEETDFISEDMKDLPVKKRLEEARKIARNIDDKNNPYEIIVSVMMLNEGWDVRNVSIIVGLRSFTSKREVLPEQVIGRGLRKMFPEEIAGDPKKNNFVNILEVIGPQGLLDVINQLEKEEGIKVDTFDIEQIPEYTTIFVDENKLKYNFTIPKITPRIERKELNLEKVDINNFQNGNFELGNKVLKTSYVASDMLTNIVVIEREWLLPIPENANSVISYYTDKILKELRLPITTNFALLYPLVKEYVKKKLFNQEVDLEDPRVLFVLSDIPTQKFIIDTFVEGLRNLTFKIEEPKLKSEINLKDTKPFTTTKDVYLANKTIFNYIPYENELELKFIKFLDYVGDVECFIKNVYKIGFYIEYKSSSEQLKSYYPDFIVKTTKGEFYIIETKGLIDIDVPLKDERTKQWCKDVSKLTNQNWNFVRVNQELFLERNYHNFYELVKIVK